MNNVWPYKCLPLSLLKLTSYCNVNALSAGAVGEFCSKSKEDNFPYVDTLKCKYTTEEVSKLSSLSSYNLVEGLKNVGFDIEQVEKGQVEMEQVEM